MASAKPKKKNPRLASGRKRARQDVKLNAANTSLRSKYRTAVKNVEKAVASGDKAKATGSFRQGAKHRRHRGRQADLPQEQGRSRQEPPRRQGQDLGHRRPPDVQAPKPGSAGCGRSRSVRHDPKPPFETGALPAKAKSRRKTAFLLASAGLRPQRPDSQCG